MNVTLTALQARERSRNELPAPPQPEREPPLVPPEPVPEDPRENTPVQDPPANPNQPHKRIARGASARCYAHRHLAS